MIWEFAGDFIRLAEMSEQRQSHLNAACSVWNIASNPAAIEKSLDRYVCEHQRLNANPSPPDLAGARSDVKKLIQRKLEMFPGDNMEPGSLRARCAWLTAAGTRNTLGS